MFKPLTVTMLLINLGMLAACSDGSTEGAAETDRVIDSVPEQSSAPRAAGSGTQDPVYAEIERLNETRKDDPQIIFSEAVADAFANRRRMMADCKLKSGSARSICEDAAAEVYRAARARASEQLEAATAVKPAAASTPE